MPVNPDFRDLFCALNAAGARYLLAGRRHLDFSHQHRPHTSLDQRRTKLAPASFAARYSANQLVYFEQFENVAEAIAREKQIKAGSRRAKLALIAIKNPSWRDLYQDFL